jgi:asparagine synthase (glutamine-hydrolysing)
MKLAQYGAPHASVLTDMLTTAFQPAELQKSARGPLAAALRNYTPVDTVRQLLRRAPPEDVGVMNAMRYLDLKLTLAGDILVKVDRASMAVALEVRPVYLHRDILTLASRIPSHLLADRTCSKKLLKSSLSAWLPDSILNRPKMGFALPLGKWLTGDLRHFATAGDSGALSELLDDSLPRTLFSRHESGTPGLTSRIHNLFFLKHWMNKWI